LPAPSRQEPENSLRTRCEDPDEMSAMRLREAAEEIRDFSAYDYVLIHRHLAAAEDHSERDCSRRARRADADRGPDPADPGIVSKLRA
jgi:guanylate kinase